MGLWEIVLIGMVALMLFSPKELPGIIKALARGYGALRRTAEEFRSQVLEDEELNEIRDAYHGTRNELLKAQQSARRELAKARVEARLAQQKIESALRAERQLGEAIEEADRGDNNADDNSASQAQPAEGQAQPAEGQAPAQAQPAPVKAPSRPAGVVRQGNDPSTPAA